MNIGIISVILFLIIGINMPMVNAETINVTPVITEPIISTPVIIDNNTPKTGQDFVNPELPYQDSNSTKPEIKPATTGTASSIASEPTDKGIIESNYVTTLSNALDNYDLSFSTGGYAYWYGDSNVYYYGGSAARSGDINDYQYTYMQTTVNGPGTVRFFWAVSSEVNYDYLEFYIDGILKDRISGSVPWQLKNYQIDTYGTHTLKWRYIKDGSVSVGSDAGFVDKLEYYTPIISLGEALDYYGSSFSTYFSSGGTSWIGQNKDCLITMSCAKSGTIPHNGYTTMYTTVSGPGQVSFWWKVSSEVNYDYLEFYIDGILKNRISGEVDWGWTSFDISSDGLHTLLWRYIKDGSVNTGKDAGYIDDLEFTPSEGLKVTSPNGGESWKTDTVQTISWTSNGGGNVKIELLKGDVVNKVIVSNIPNSGSYNWGIPAQQTLGNDYKIRVISISNPSHIDSSDSNFNIVAPMRLNPGDVLTAGGSLYSQDYRYRLTMQTDGNLVLYNPSNKAIWASNTIGSNYKVTMQPDGNLVITNSAGKPKWSSKTAGNSGAWLIVQRDGNAVIYNVNGRAIWATNTVGK